MLCFHTSSEAVQQTKKSRVAHQMRGNKAESSILWCDASLTRRHKLNHPAIFFQEITMATKSTKEHSVELKSTPLKCCQIERKQKKKKWCDTEEGSKQSESSARVRGDMGGGIFFGNIVVFFSGSLMVSHRTHSKKKRNENEGKKVSTDWQG